MAKDQNKLTDLLLTDDAESTDEELLGTSDNVVRKVLLNIIASLALF